MVRASRRPAAEEEAGPSRGRFPLSGEERRFLAAEIEAAGGVEVLSAATVQEDGGWSDLRILARGTADRAPAVLRGLRPGDVLLHNHPTGGLSPSDADLQVASLCGQSGIGFAIHDNACQRAFIVVEPFQPEQVEPLDAAAIAALFGPDGPIRRLLPRFEAHEGQMGLLEAVIDAFNTPCHAILEGETGVGKSLAYLVPALYFAHLNKCRVVVSTNTINLQQQLCQKDLPFLQKALPFSFSFCLVKGRGNYLCRRKMEEISTATDGEVLLDLDELEQFSRLQAWAAKTTDGSLADLAWVPADKLWEKLNAEKDSCLGVKCHHYNPCFFYTARRKAAETDLLVVNHHLLFTDLALRAAMQEYEQTAIIPGYRAAVLDEAHNLEDIATRHFGFRTTALGLHRQLSRLHQRRGRREKGVLAILTARLEEGLGPYSATERQGLLKTIRDDLIPRCHDVGGYANDLFDQIVDLVLGSREPPGGEYKLRLAPALERSEPFARVKLAADKLDGHLQEFTKALRRLGRKLATGLEDDDAGRKAFEVPLAELGSLATRFAETREGLRLVFDPEAAGREGFVHFFAVMARGRSRYPSVHSAPISVAETMVDHVFQPIPRVVLVSATLSTQRSFDFIMSRLGLDTDTIHPEPITGRFPSPFDYECQARLFVPIDLPEPSRSDFLAALHEPLFQIVQTSQGGALILCTSHAQVHGLAEALTERFTAAGLAVFKQGEMERHHLLDRFREDGNGVLFATDSFWEGIDVPGQALRNLIIIKLPFAVPDDPVLAARQELLEAQGRNPFADYQLPLAAIKLKQGFGRLIRSKDDRGTVWILDRRLISKPYGRYFLESLPPARLVKGPLPRLLAEARGFFSPPPAGR
ncbi:MAG: DinG family ATP-dependent helicase YoaA [Candidatus Ozemobacter sibiricus]|jgi:ATP-dependent DNA helicase DinG|uniref:DNA 5'-3' helicase n=1 Tax=Candidatus Ozemobacter sibiricus TaxID=2268124 RepID=A0A367ZKI9_9BACT|nr:MAG: DinG family ATP-dependent helicase YoaA [Candidatus Ozemobacter sibiricus]